MSAELNPKETRGAELIAIREKSGLGQAQCARRCGVSLTTWRSWEKNRRAMGRLELQAIRVILHQGRRRTD